ncbi:MAG TPA: DUF503 domain-containing protein [Nitrospirae bacterium]|nr:hypothetical protein BMS3Abin10_02441 [bacterium BMS3Abin10]GBE38924.1 hypothetical protein BMS3Bbin08_01541 [bacterium BMS3Bbin08]HDH50462.1 DUF503 domain-containing protein [Nitrospirota bacterium]HDK81165.1 DUF503 domain-containing protein [Nitrospirota bacterium]
MIVGILTLELHLPEANSLKSKRIIIKSLKDRIKNKFNVSIAEVGANDLWQRSVLGAACVANETRMANQILDGVRNMVISNPSVELINSSMEML